MVCTMYHMLNDYFFNTLYNDMEHNERDGILLFLFNYTAM